VLKEKANRQLISQRYFAECHFWKLRAEGSARSDLIYGTCPKFLQSRPALTLEKFDLLFRSCGFGGLKLRYTLG
jgi:hypothetical protein